jgi:hypothetical protein
VRFRKINISLFTTLPKSTLFASLFNPHQSMANCPVSGGDTTRDYRILWA